MSGVYCPATTNLSPCSGGATIDPLGQRKNDPRSPPPKPAQNGLELLWKREVDFLKADLLDFSCEWVLPGHGEGVTLEADAMRQELRALVERM